MAGRYLMPHNYHLILHFWWCGMALIFGGCVTPSWAVSRTSSPHLFWLFIMLGNIPPVLWLQPQLVCHSPLAIHHLWVSLPLPPSFGLSLTSLICWVRVGISFGKLMALSLHLFCDILPSIYPRESSHIFLFAVMLGIFWWSNYVLC